MKNLNTFKKIVLLVLATTTIISCERNSTFEDTKPSIAKIAVLNPSFSTLEAAAIKGGVAGVLSNYNAGDPSGHFTVFAPTNDAFLRLGLTSENLSLLNQTFLTNTLLYAVSNGDLTSGAFIPANLSGSAFQGVTRRFVNRGGEQFINGSKILIKDVSAINGTVHGIDKVLLATGGNIVQSALAVQSGGVFVQKDLTYLVEAVIYCDLLTALSNPSANLTVFAPNDQAFKNLGIALGLPPFTQPSDIRQIPKATVTAVMLNHVLGTGGKFTSELNAGAVTNLNGTSLTLGAYNNGVLSVKGPTATSTPGNMTIPDIQATNGVIHIIDKVML
jgi:uncharacterized surface protein with fasciclin (FAS1) repeats